MTLHAPWHPGERALHDQLGVRERMAEIGPRVIREFMPAQHTELFEKLPFMLLGAVDGQGDPWASLVHGRPGFVRALDDRTLAIAARPSDEDPSAAGLSPGAALGLLGLEPHTRRRNRVNGHVAALVEPRGARPPGFVVAVEHSFGNCPKYIAPRRLAFELRPAPADQVRSATIRTEALDAHARALITAADTLFVASYVDLPEGRQVDVSHRGGPPGFVQIDAAGTLTIPDYAGNRFFNTLGNISLQPRVGLLFVDFVRGELVQLSGEAELLLDPDDPRVRALPGAERAWTVRPRAVVRRSAPVREA